MARIATIGGIRQDIFLVDRDDFVPSKAENKSLFGKIEIGSVIDIDLVKFDVGGSGIIPSIAFARQGHESVLMGNIGRDSAGEAVMGMLDLEGVDNSFLGYAEGLNTDVSVVLIDAVLGARTVLSHRSASKNLIGVEPRDLELIKPDWLCVGRVGGKMEFLLDLFELATSKGIKIAFRPGEKELAKKKKLLGLLADVSLLVVNKEMAEKMVGEGSLAEVMNRLANYVKMVVVTNGKMGGIGTDGEGVWRFGMYKDIKVVDPTGAGDAFFAGMLSALAHGRKFEEALVLASANATSVIGAFSAREGILRQGAKIGSMPMQKIR